MVRKIELEIEGVKALATMNDDTCPKACNTIWNRLPMEGPAISAKWACKEIMLHLTGNLYFELESEGLRRAGSGPGDIGYALRGGTLYGAQKDYDPEFRYKLCEFTFYYGLATGGSGDPGRNMDRDKWEAKPEIRGGGVTWAHLVPPLSRDFILKCESIRHGRKKLIIRRYEE